MTLFLLVFLRFCYYGALCFSGGGVLFPIYIEDFVNKMELLTMHELGNLSAISQMTPGPIGINLATFLGFRIAGFWGALAATTGLLFVPYFLMLFAVKSLEKWEQSRVVRGLFLGIKPATIGLMLAAMVIYFEMSIFSGPIPWGYFWKILGPVSNDTYVRPLAVVIFVISGFLLYRTKITIMSVIIGSAVVGAIFAKFLQ